MRIWIVVLCLFFVGCPLEGPVGPQGEQGEQGIQGEDGSNLSIKIITGILYTENKTENEWPTWNCWDIIIMGSEESIISVHTRKGSGFMWVEPEWYLGKNASYVRIFETNGVEAGCEYRIAIAN